MAPDRAATTAQGHELLRAARGGDEVAYGRLLEPHRVELHAHCYRMLGSVQDAEDRGEQITNVTAFIARAVRRPEHEAVGRWPEEPAEPELLKAAFGRFGLPDRLTDGAWAARARTIVGGTDV